LRCITYFLLKFLYSPIFHHFLRVEIRFQQLYFVILDVILFFKKVFFLQDVSRQLLKPLQCIIPHRLCNFNLILQCQDLVVFSFVSLNQLSFQLFLILYFLFHCANLDFLGFHFVAEESSSLLCFRGYFFKFLNKLLFGRT